MDFNVDITELEKQRYKAIKEKGSYIEVNILVDSEMEAINDNDRNNTPVVNVNINNCTGQGIACMYVTLQSVINQFKQDFPLECLLGETTLKSKVSHIAYDAEKQVKEGSDNDENNTL